MKLRRNTRFVEEVPLTQANAELLVRTLTGTELVIAWGVVAGLPKPVLRKLAKVQGRVLDNSLAMIRYKLCVAETYGIPVIMIRARGFDVPAAVCEEQAAAGKQGQGDGDEAQ